MLVSYIIFIKFKTKLYKIFLYSCYEVQYQSGNSGNFCLLKPVPLINVGKLKKK